MSIERCRVCLGSTKLFGIFETLHSDKISNLLFSLCGVQIYPNDGLPSRICSKCLRTLKQCCKFISKCKKTDLVLRSQCVDQNELYQDDFKSDSSSAFVVEETTHDFDNDDKTNVFSDRCEVRLDENVESDKDVKVKSRNRIKKTKKEQCSTCGKVMSSRFRLKTHLRTHTGERPYSCPHCNKTFSLSQNLKVHIRTHTGEKPLVCTFCNATFAQPAGLAAHKRKHTGQMPYLCTLCPRTFRTAGHLQYHVRGHTGEKNFECDSCGRAFITRSDLKQHLYVHSGDKPHVCCICGLKLSRASHLKRHMTIHHKKQNENVIEKENDENKDSN